MLRVKLVRSPIGNTKRNRAVVQSLGLRKMNQVVEHQDVPSIRGMIRKVAHLVLVEEIADSEPKPAKAAKAEKAAETETKAKAPAKKKKEPQTEEAQPAESQE